MTDITHKGERSSGLAGAARGVLHTALDILRTRAELVSLEFEEARRHLVALVALAAAAVAAASLLVVMASFALVLQFWDTPHRMTVVWSLGGLYAVAGAGIALALAHRLRHMPLLFQGSLDQIRRDQSWLR